MAALVASSWETAALEAEAVPTNKLIAAMLLVGQQARSVPSDQPLHWQLLAASTLLSGMIGGVAPQ
jgi:hypothetical protein